MPSVSSCAGRVCLDAGASTGGFTDVLLSRGASLCLRGGRRPRPARSATGDRSARPRDGSHQPALARRRSPGPPPDLVTLDLSFISLRLVMPAVVRLIAPGGADLVALFKPQFELGREAIGKGGIVRDPDAAARSRRRRSPRGSSPTFGAVRAHPDALAGARGQGQSRVAGRSASRPQSTPPDAHEP